LFTEEPFVQQNEQFQCFKVEAIDIHLLFNRGKLISQVKEVRGEDIPKLFSHPKVGKYFWQVN